MMMKKPIVNLSFKIAAQFHPSNQSRRLAQAQLIFFSRQMTANKVKVRKIDEDESQMDDDEKIYREFFI